MKPALVLSLFLMLAPAPIVEAAELPMRQTQPTPAAKTCQIDGQAGVLLPDSDTCLHVSGSVSGQAGFGNTTPQSRQKNAP